MTDNQLVNRGGRSVVLDMFRIVLALLIFFFHSNCHLGCTYGFLSTFFSFGNVAMTGFFMLSGYAMTLGYGKKDFKEWNDYKTFYIKRLITIYPLYIVTGNLFVLMNIVVGKQTIIDNLLLLPIEVMGIQAIFSGSLFAYAHNSGTWFVSCILLSYLLFPIILMGIRNMKHSALSVLLVGVIASMIYIPYIDITFSSHDLYTNPFYRLIEFSSGVLLAFNRSKKRLNSVYAILLAVSCILLITGISIASANKYLIVAPCFATIIWCCGNIQLNSNSAIRYMSSLAYAFFLAQFFVWNPFKFLILKTGRLSNEVLVIISFVSCVVISVVLYEFIDKPAQNYLKKKF